MIERCKIGTDLTITSFIGLARELLEKTGLVVSTLGCDSYSIASAYEAIREARLPYTRIIVLVGVPADFWFVSNERGLIWSPGA